MTESQLPDSSTEAGTAKFESHISATSDSSLDAVWSHLSEHPDVVAALSLGSVAAGTMKESSDYDLLVVHRDHEPGFSVEVATIDGRLADILIFDESRLVRLCELTNNPTSDDRQLAYWLQTARVEVDASGLAAKAVAAAKQMNLSHTAPEELFHLWQWINYDLRVNETYVRSGDPHRLEALRLRSLHTVTRAFQGWFSIRGIPWEGEKKALVLLENAEPALLRLLRNWLDDSDLTRKVELERKIVTIVLEPIGEVWSPGEVADDAVWQSLTTGRHESG